MKRNYNIFIVVLMTMFSMVALCGCTLFGGKSDSEQEPDPINLYEQCYYSFVGDNSFEYDGMPKTPKFEIMCGSDKVATIGGDAVDDDLEIEYSNNIDVGYASAKIKAKVGSKKFSGSLTATFRIDSRKFNISTFSELKICLTNPNNRTLTLTADIEIPSDEIITIGQNVGLNFGEYTLTNYGEIHNNGKIYVFDMRNYGKIENKSEIRLNDGSDLYNWGEYQSDGGIIKCFGWSDIYTNSTITRYDIQRDLYSFGFDYFLKDIEDCYIKLQFDEANYTGAEVMPNVIIKSSQLDKNEFKLSNFEISYENNTNVGTAKVVIKSKSDSTVTYGTKEVTFKINAITKDCDSFEKLEAAFLDDNISEIRLTTLYGLNGKIVIPENKIVYIDSNCYDFIGEIENYGKLIVNSQKIINFKQKFTNYGEFINNGKILINGEFENAGDFKNVGKIYQCPAAAIVLSENIENYGEIYLNFQTSNIDDVDQGKHVARVNLNSDDVVLSQNEFDYTSNAIVPDILIDDQIINDEHYSVVYKYDGETSTVTSVKDFGLVEMTVTARDESSTYFGTKTFTFNILQVETTVTTQSQFSAVINNKNYKKITISGCQVRYAEYTTIKQEIVIEQDARFVAAYQIYIASKITNNGKIICDSTNKTRNTACLTLKDGGEVINNGEIYFNDIQSCEVLGDGEIYVRKHMTDEAITVDYDDVVEYSQPLTYPGVVVTHEVAGVLGSSDCAVRIPSINGVNVYTITLQAQLLSKLVWGERSCVFEVVRGVTQVSSFSQLIYQMSSGNWKKLIATDEISCTSAFTIPAGVIVDCSNYKISFNTSVSSYNCLVCGELWVSSAYGWGAFRHNPNSPGKVVLFAHNNIELNKFNPSTNSICDEIRIANNIEGSGLIANYGTKDLIVDLQGYTVDGLSLQASSGNIYLKSSVEGACLGSPSLSTVALSCSVKKDLTIKIEDIKIYRMQCRYSREYEEGTVIVSGCDIEGDPTDLESFGVLLQSYYIYQFTNCQIMGYCGMRIACGNILLKGCTIEGRGEYLSYGRAAAQDGKFRYGNAISVLCDQNPQRDYLRLRVTDCNLISAFGYGIDVSVNSTRTNTYGTIVGDNTVSFSDGLRKTRYDTKFSSSPFSGF